MLRLQYKLRLNERITAKCSRHPRYNPEIDGRGGIIDRCAGCYGLYDLFQAKAELDASVRLFLRRAGPWTRPRSQRKRSSASGISASTDTSEVQG
jgi:hypothetical protein